MSEPVMLWHYAKTGGWWGREPSTFVRDRERDIASLGVVEFRALPADEFATLTRERDESRDAVRLLYDKWENGTPCSDDFDEDGRATGGDLGHAFTLSEGEENAVLSVLERAAPGTTILATPETRASLASLTADLASAHTALAELGILVRWGAGIVSRLSDRDGAHLTIDANDWDDIKTFQAKVRALPASKRTAFESHPAYGLLHDLWTAAVGTKNYDKKKWHNLESEMRKLVTGS